MRYKEERQRKCWHAWSKGYLPVSGCQVCLLCGALRGIRFGGPGAIARAKINPGSKKTLACQTRIAIAVRKPALGAVVRVGAGRAMTAKAAAAHAAAGAI